MAKPKTDIIIKPRKKQTVFELIKLTRVALRKGGYSNLIEDFTREATSGDYQNAIRTIKSYCYIKK